MGEKRDKEPFVSGSGVRAGCARPGRGLKRAQTGFPVLLHALPFPETIYLNAGDVGGIENALNLAGLILSMNEPEAPMAKRGRTRSGMELRRGRGEGRNMGFLSGGIQ